MKQDRLSSEGTPPQTRYRHIFAPVTLTLKRLPWYTSLI